MTRENIAATDQQHIMLPIAHCSVRCCLQEPHAATRFAAGRTREAAYCVFLHLNLSCLQQMKAAGGGVASTPRERTHMVSPTAKVDMVVPAKASAHTEPMFLTNLQQSNDAAVKRYSGQTMQQATVDVCGAACTQQNFARKDMVLLDPLFYHATWMLHLLQHVARACSQLHIAQPCQLLLLLSGSCCSCTCGAYAVHVLTGESPS
jgi:hypothetical protein